MKMQWVIMILLALFVDYLEYSQKYDDKMREEEACLRAEAEKAAKSPKPCPLCGMTPDKTGATARDAV
jgi:hypothetical protein